MFSAETAPLYLALGAGFFYACSAVLCKKALEKGSGTIRALIYSNLFMSACFLPYPFFADQPIAWQDLQSGSCLGTLFFLGQLFCFLALKNGEASLITPIMGSKPIFVALFLLAHGLTVGQIPWQTWWASGLASFAIALICWPNKKSSVLWKGLAFALAAAAAFGLLDSLVPHFTHISNPLNVLFFIFGSVGIFSLSLIPWSEGKFFTYRKNADLWMWASALPMGLQAVLMSIAIGLFRVPTEANVFYACRGLWAVLLIAFIGKKLELTEGGSGKYTLIRRGAGSIMMIAGIWMITNG